MDDIYQASTFKRIIASALDVIVTTLLSLGIFMLLVNGAIDIGFHNLGYKIDQFKVQEESSLFYVRKDEGGNFLEVSTLTYDENKADEYNTFLTKINDYYFNFVEKENKSNREFNIKYMLFDETTLKNSIFSITSINDSYLDYTFLDVVKDVSTNKDINKSDTAAFNLAVKNFFTDENKGVYNLALSEFTGCNRFQNIVNQLALIERMEILVCVSFSTLIFISLPILINKHGETAFMHVLGICFVDSYGYKIKWRHKIIRAIVTILINTASAYLFGIPLVVNAIIFLLTPSKRSLVDLASNETAIDRKTSVIIEETSSV